MKIEEKILKIYVCEKCGARFQMLELYDEHICGCPRFTCLNGCGKPVIAGGYHHCYMDIEKFNRMKMIIGIIANELRAEQVNGEQQKLDQCGERE